MSNLNKQTKVSAPETRVPRDYAGVTTSDRTFAPETPQPSPDDSIRWPATTAMRLSHQVMEQTEKLQSLEAHIRDLKAERDELLKALTIVWKDDSARFGVDKETNTPISEIIRRAITKDRTGAK